MLRQDGTSDNSIICADGRRRPAKYWLRRGEQRRLLDEMRLPKSIVVSRTTAEDGTERVTKIAAASARHVLRIIDDYLRSPNGENGKPLSLELIVKRTSISKEVVLRAIRVLNDSKFIDADGYSDDHFGRCYRVIRRWKDIARKVDRWNDTGHTSPPRQDDTQDDTHPDTQDDTRTLLRATKRATNTPPPPPAPSAVTDPPHGLATDPPRDLWGEVGEALRKAGVQAWRDTLTAIRDQRGMTPDRAKALCRYFGDHHARLGIQPGKLVYRLKNDHPDRPIHDGWTIGDKATKPASQIDLMPAIRQLQSMPAAELDSVAARHLHGVLPRLFAEQRLGSEPVRTALARALIREGVTP